MYMLRGIELLDPAEWDKGIRFFAEQWRAGKELEELSHHIQAMLYVGQVSEARAVLQRIETARVR